MEAKIHNVALITKIGNREAYSAAMKVATLLSRRKIRVYSVLPFIIDYATPIRPDELNDIKLDLVFAQSTKPSRQYLQASIFTIVA
jgi:hypothetical protein